MSNKIIHKGTKDRKDFILDCLFVGVGISIFYVSVNEEFKEGVISLHKNKHRKNKKRLKDIYDQLDGYKKDIYDKLDTKDLKCLNHKVETLAFKNFITTIGKSEDDLCLEYLAICILKAGLSRKRKTLAHNIFKPFKDYLLLSKVTKEVKSAINYTYKKEYNIALEFCEKIKY